MMEYLKVILCVVLIINAGSFALAEMSEEEKSLYLEKYQDNLQKRVAEANVNINFYGKIEDQNGAPVVGAEVEYQLTRYNIVTFMDVFTKHATSDSTGRFEIINETGDSLSISEIKKEGYSYSYSDNNTRGFNFWAELEINRFVPNEKEPIIFNVRKQGELTFTIESSELMSKDIVFGKIFYGSLKDGRVWPSDHKRFKFQRDFEIIAQKRADQDPILTITTLGVNSGIILSNEAVFIAPTIGYNNSLEVICEEDKKYTFFMKNSDSLYARMEGRFSSMEPDAPLVRMSISSWLNPYGDRNLETESNIPYEIRKKLKRDAMAAFRDNKIPEKPDLQQLISGQ